MTNGILVICPIEGKYCGRCLRWLFCGLFDLRETVILFKTSKIMIKQSFKVSKISLWAVRRQEFQSYDVNTFMRSWDAVLEGGGFKSHQSFSWRPPPMGMWNLNFDRSYIREVNRGGIEGVIRDHDASIIRTYSRTEWCY